MNYPWLQSLETEFAERLGAERLAHAFLLSGPSGSGKLALATGFVASALCLEQSYPACRNCRSCQLLESGAHPDRYILSYEEHPKTGELRKDILIGQVRALIGSLQLTRGLSPRKAALVHPAEAMTKSAANALLKTLEEPPGDSVLILVSHNPSRLPATIRSRCQRFNARLPEPSLALEWLSAKGRASRAEAKLALEAAAGSPLRALRMLEDGGMEQYRLVGETLSALRSGNQSTVAAMAALAEMEPGQLWAWLSLRTAEEIKAAADPARDAAELCRLQLLADRYRNLVPTPVRKDLLLRDWLIQWVRLNDQGL